MTDKSDLAIDSTRRFGGLTHNQVTLKGVEKALRAAIMDHSPINIIVVDSERRSAALMRLLERITAESDFFGIGIVLCAPKRIKSHDDLMALPGRIELLQTGGVPGVADMTSQMVAISKKWQQQDQDLMAGVKKLA